MSKKANKPTTTAKGTYLLAVDRQNLFARHRHVEAETVKTECKRLAADLGERLLVLQVVGVLDRRGQPPRRSQRPAVNSTVGRESVSS